MEEKIIYHYLLTLLCRFAYSSLNLLQVSCVHLLLIQHVNLLLSNNVLRGQMSM